jgi:hypothetical protein
VGQRGELLIGANNGLRVECIAVVFFIGVEFIKEIANQGIPLRKELSQDFFSLSFSNHK